MSPSASTIAVPRIPVGAVFVLALALFAVLPARADVRILSSSGGLCRYKLEPPEVGPELRSWSKALGLGYKEVPMLRAATKAGIGIISLLASLPLFGAEIRFKTMRVPPDTHVQIEGSAARISGRLGIETVWNCSCTKGEGTCTIKKSEGVIACSKGAADTCKADCFLSLNVGGLQGSSPNQ
jgi:hypothetical protein